MTRREHEQGSVAAPAATIRRPATMGAIVQDRFGLPSEVLELREVPRPEPAGDETLVRVRASGVNIGDWLAVQGLPYIARPGYGLRRPKHPIAGHAFAGVVERGGGGRGMEPGAPVYGSAPGAFAGYVTAGREALAPMPENLTFEQAAAVPVPGCAALRGLRDVGDLQAGQRVLVVGASGAVGSAAVQIAKAFGAHVTGVCGPSSVDMVRSLGADDIIDHTREDYTRHAPRFDLILDMVGRRSTSDVLRALTREGTLVSVGTSGGRWTMGFGRTLRRSMRSPFVRPRLKTLLSDETSSDLLALKELIEAGRLTPVIAQTYGLGSAVEALREVGERRGRGQTVITH